MLPLALLALVALLVIAGSLYDRPATSSPQATPVSFQSAEAAAVTNVSVDQRPVLVYRGHNGPALHVAWSPDGSRLAASGADATVLVWDARTGKRLLLTRIPSSSGTIYSVAWSPDGSRIVLGEGSATGGTAQVWNVFTGKLLLTYLTTSLTAVLHVAWSPDGSRIASSSASMVDVWKATTGTIQIWNAFLGQQVMTLVDQQNINGIAWFPRGPLIATAGEDGLVKVWVIA